MSPLAKPSPTATAATVTDRVATLPRKTFSVIRTRQCANFNSSKTPAIVYFPQGTYKVSTPLVLIYQTQMIGDARKPPTLLAASNLSGIAMIGKSIRAAASLLALTQTACRCRPVPR